MSNDTMASDDALKHIIGDNIRRILRDKKKTQTWLAAEIGSTRESIGQSVAGKAAISLRRVCEIAEALDVPVTDLLLDDDDREAIAIGRTMTDDFARWDVMHMIADLDYDIVNCLRGILCRL